MLKGTCSRMADKLLVSESEWTEQQIPLSLCIRVTALYDSLVVQCALEILLLKYCTIFTSICSHLVKSKVQRKNVFIK